MDIYDYSVQRPNGSGLKNDPDIKRYFTKFVVGRYCKAVKRYEPTVDMNAAAEYIKRLM